MIGNREQILFRLQRDLELGANKNFNYFSTSEERGSVSSDSPVSSVSSDSSASPYQTFPGTLSEPIVVKQHGDLTCGMRCLQNMYGAYIVTREEMDTSAKQLELKSFGETMFNPQYGDYSIEVLKDVLLSKGKWAQRIDIQKIPSEFFIPSVEANPTFVGYIVAFDGHYVTVKCHNGVYKCIDSLVNTPTRTIQRDSLFKKRTGVFCSQELDDTREVVALIAVGGSPFVEYTLLHDSWSTRQLCPTSYMRSIQRALNPQVKQVYQRASGNVEVLQWYNQWKTTRIQPSEKCLQYLTTFVQEMHSDYKTIVVQMEEHQTAIRCTSIQGLIHELVEMQWITPGTEFFLQTSTSIIKDEGGNEVELDSYGSLHEYGIVENVPITLLTQVRTKVGGFYTFRCVVEGTCIDQQHNAYSVRDKSGKIHILYKHCIETITQ